MTELKKTHCFSVSFFSFCENESAGSLHVRVEIERTSAVQFVCFKVCLNALWLWISSVLVNVPHAFENNVYSTVFFFCDVIY